MGRDGADSVFIVLRVGRRDPATLFPPRDSLLSPVMYVCIVECACQEAVSFECMLIGRRVWCKGK
jgi:hypothetical protein